MKGGDWRRTAEMRVEGRSGGRVGEMHFSLCARGAALAGRWSGPAGVISSRAASLPEMCTRLGCSSRPQMSARL